jgi:hypothetical protein
MNAQRHTHTERNDLKWLGGGRDDSRDIITKNINEIWQLVGDVQHTLKTIAELTSNISTYVGSGNFKVEDNDDSNKK